MSNLQHWSDNRTARTSTPAPVSGFVPAVAPSEFRSAPFRVELVLFLLLVATFAAVLFRGAIVDRRFTLDADSVGQFVRYWFADQSSGGKSTSSGNRAGQMEWSCDLRAGFAYPYCGSGIILDGARNGGGRDFSKFSKAIVDLDYRGPSRQLKITFKNLSQVTATTKSNASAKPVFLQFPAVAGHNLIELKLADAAVEQWWAILNRSAADAATPQFDNVVAIEVQTGEGASLGHHNFRLRRIEFVGPALSVENWYLILLGCWTGIAALYLVYRVVGIKRVYVSRQQILLAEGRLLEEARDAAESASQAKSRFLAHMSHELRTPLNAILGYAQILKATGETERQRGAARTIQQSGEHLLSLITDILDLSRIEAGKLDLAPRPVDLRQMICGVADMIAVRAQEKDVGFHWAVASDVPRGILADDKCLRQVLINLLGNAVKFTDRGEVRLQVGVLSTGGGEVQLRFDVRDTGVGIATDKLQAIFEPFEQAGDLAQRAGGTGLGLSISRRLAEAMGGSLQVESTLGVGSRFWFDVALPLADSSALPPAVVEAESGSVALRQPSGDFPAVPAGASMDRLHDFAMAGNMRAIRGEAERLIRDEPHVRAFAEALLALTRNYQSQAILELIEKHKSERVAV